jgi:hypothetical protein
LKGIVVNCRNELLQNNSRGRIMPRYTDEEIKIIKGYATKHSRTSDEDVARMLQENHFYERPLQGLINQVARYRDPSLLSKWSLKKRKLSIPSIGDIVKGYQCSDSDIKVTLWITYINKEGYIYGRILTSEMKIDVDQSYMATEIDPSKGIRIIKRNVAYTEV